MVVLYISLKGCEEIQAMEAFVIYCRELYLFWRANRGQVLPQTPPFSTCSNKPK